MQQEEKILYKASLVFCVENKNVWLAIKSSGIGKGCLNGYGGGVESDETFEESAIRELEEESSVIGQEKHLEKVAIIYFHNTKSNGEKFILELFVYILREWEGEFKETEKKEMLNPLPYKISNLPLKKMMVGDRDWVSEVLSGKKIIAHVYYGPFQKELLQETEISFVNSFA